jgi:hypothetical protein
MGANSFSTDNTSLILNGYGFTAYLDGDIIELNPVNPATARQRGAKLVNIIKRSDADVHDLIIRLMRYSNDDIYLNTQRNQPRPVIFTGSLKVNYLSETGVESVESYDLQGGSFTEQPPKVINNVDGNSLMQYTIQFDSCIRTI